MKRLRQKVTCRLLKSLLLKGKRMILTLIKMARKTFIRYYCNNYIGEEKLFLYHLSLIGNLQIKVTQDTKW